MEITQAYAIAVSGTFLVLFLANYHRFIRHWIHAIRLFLSKVSYIRALRRFKRIGPWHLNTALLLAIFIIVNVYLTLFRGLFQPVSAKEVSVRAANLTLINLVPVIAGPSQSFLASIFGTSLKTFQKVYRSLALMSLLLSIFHVVAAIISMRSFFLNVISNRWAIAKRLEKEFDEGRLKKEICLNNDIVQTKKLLRYTRIHRDGTPCRALFTGPYGINIPTRDCGILLLVASGLGIVAQIPYLKRRSRAYRIHLVWQLKTLDLAFIFEDILNEALAEDTLENGRSERDANTNVSGSKGVRDELCRIARGYVYDKVSFVKLKYQPD
ncbi:hypothetical protein QBC46DRAFT_407684 [Diplogelasinospora grovesii]|uniref:Ferric oxidoreductase domain-containing protein n=1 Tax=Diplogelasinospora grovesii TaxID=303347 RepID=A0AAN6N873_9PEZI|nr:hypothetical protein QBC46DRAFT_407684 [Diplogelasinospora grovesii]